MAGSDAAEALKEFIGQLIDGLRRSHRRDVLIGCCVAAVVSVLIAKAMVLSDIRRLEEKIDSVRIAMEASDRPKSIEASGNTVNVTRGDTFQELVKHYMMLKEVKNGDLHGAIGTTQSSEPAVSDSRGGGGDSLREHAGGSDFAGVHN